MGTTGEVYYPHDAALTQRDEIPGLEHRETIPFEADAADRGRFAQAADAELFGSRQGSRSKT